MHCRRFPLAFRLFLRFSGVLFRAGLIIAVTNDGLPPDDANEHAPVIHHRHKVLVHGRLHQLIHAGGHGHGLVVPLVRERRDGHVLRCFQIQPMELFQSPQDVSLRQGAHILAPAVEHRDGSIAVVLPFFKGLTQGEIVINVHQVLLGGKEKQNIHQTTLLFCYFCRLGRLIPV